MTQQTLIELYQLTTKYINNYKPKPGTTIEDMLSQISEKYTTITHGKDIRTARNPRGAGRPKEIGETTDNRILKMRAEGRTLREIAYENSCSTYYVSKILAKAKQKEVDKEAQS